MSHYLIELTPTGPTVYRTDGKLEEGVTGPHPDLNAVALALPDGAVYTICQIEPERKPIANPSHGYNGGSVSRKK